MFAGTMSKRGNKCAQAYCTSYGWARAYPIKTKGCAHETLTRLFKAVSVPPTMITDNAAELTGGDVARKCKEDDCPLRHTKLYSPW